MEEPFLATNYLQILQGLSPANHNIRKRVRKVINQLNWKFGGNNQHMK
jgi:hypothetical protein